MNITEEVNEFREAARHLWNSYMRWEKDYYQINPNLDLRGRVTLFMSLAIFVVFFFAKKSIIASASRLHQ
jgi:hypothetical protein